MKLGQWGERKAEDFLIENGFVILDRNFRSRRGEIDLIVEKDGVIHFVEVKTRSSEEHGIPSEAITGKKISRILMTIHYYIYINQLEDTDIQIDVIEITDSRVNHMENVVIL